MEKIENYVEDLFKEVPNTKKARELKEEISSDLKEKYQDLIKEGKEEHEAFKEIVAGIGNVEELLESVQEKESNPMNTFYVQKQRQKTALIVSISIGLYIICLIALAVTDELNLPESVQMATFFSIAGFATCLLVYRFMSIPKYEKISNTMVEDFKEWKQGKERKESIRKSLYTILWLLIVTVYFLISFIYGIWYISWIIFIMGALLQKVIDLIIDLRDDQR